MANEFERFNFYNDKEKTIFDLQFKINLNSPRTYTVNKETQTKVCSDTLLPIDLTSLTIAQQIFSEHFKNKALASFMTQLGYIFNGQLANSSLHDYEHISENLRYYTRTQSVVISQEDFKLKILGMQDKIKQGFLFNKGVLNLSTQNMNKVNVMHYTRNMLNLNSITYDFKLITDKDKSFQPQLCLYSKSHIDKMTAFIKRINNFYAKESGILSVLNKIKGDSVLAKSQDKLIVTSFNPSYGLYGFSTENSNTTNMDKNPAYEYSIKEKDFLDFAIILIERIKLNFEQVHQLFKENKLSADSITSVEYQGSFARADDFENQKYYIYMAKSAKGDVGFVGINPASAKGYNSSNHSLSIVKDVSQALTFKTKNPLETGFKELKPDSYYIKDIHALEIETKFLATNDEYADPKMQAIAAMLMKKELQNNIKELPIIEKEQLVVDLNTPSVSVSVKRNKL